MGSPVTTLTFWLSDALQNGHNSTNMINLVNLVFENSLPLLKLFLY